MTKTERSVVNFPVPADLELVRRAAARIGLQPASFLRMAGIERARVVLNTVPEVEPAAPPVASAEEAKR